MSFVLTSKLFTVTVTPERGADITQIVDQATGIPLLSVSPTADVTTPSAYGATTMARWTNGYPGGWQFLTPNAGPERERYGVVQGYHGESSLTEWNVVSVSESTAELSARLLTVPFSLHRTITLTDDELIVQDTVQNLADLPIDARLLQHPAFGAPFLDEHSYIVTDAQSLISDAEMPGTLAPPNQEGAPSAVLPAGSQPGSIGIPAPGSAQSFFGALTDFSSEQPAVTFASPTHGFGIEVAWDRLVYPAAWLWIEANAGSGWPWFQRMYAVAVEPGNLIPGTGTTPSGRQRGGEGTTIAGKSSLESTIRLRRTELCQPESRDSKLNGKL